MLKNEMNLMLSSLMNNKKAFKKFYKTGYCSYSQDKPFKGAVAIVNDKAILSFLQDLDDESQVIATASFQDNTTFILQLHGDHFSRILSGKLPYRHSSSRDSVVSDISSVRKHCTEAKENLASSSHHFIKSIFSKSDHPSGKKLSKQEVRFMLEKTLDELNKARDLNNRDRIVPKVDTTNIVNGTSPIVDHSILDEIQEI